MVGQSVAARTCLERFSVSLVYDQAGPFGEREPSEGKMILYCRTMLTVERVVCLVCARSLPNRRLSLKSRRHVNSPIRIHANQIAISNE